MANMFGAVDFGFRPIRPDEDSLHSRPAASTATAMDCGSGYDVRPEPAGSADWLETDALSDDDLFISDNETLPDATGFGARQRELNEAQAAKLAAERRPALRSPFRGTTLTELCERFGDCNPASATPGNVWCEVLETLRERERTKQRWRLDPNTAAHMKYRTTLIEWILEVCADFGFGPTTADLAVQYMDRVLSKVNVPKTSLQLVAMCCLEVAVKYEEVEQDVPSLPKLRKCASNVYSCEIIKKMELAGACDLPPTRRSPRAPTRVARFKQSNLLRRRRRRRERSTDRDPPESRTPSLRSAHRARMGSRDGGVRAFPRVRVRRHRRRHVSPRRRGRSALDASVRRAAPEAVLLPAQHLPAGCAPGGDRHGVQARRGHHRHRTAATEHLPRVAQRARRRRRIPERRARPHHVQDSRAVQGGDARGARE
uniref:Cyclin-like domain-containing protein n=1 Tax=Micromonas pusilla TaxID=38833 RepID=A0A7S0IGK4_MICPS|mmetsp:Transcript_5944/g.24550  ORF Transcript_5944/g.24550 Transcript_5944/m.24550 type:complete len:428 (+) Transcript_5944:497-1780(+)